MTNKEAIEKLKEILFMTGYTEAIDLAIKALEFAESQRLCCNNYCVNYNRKSKEVCTSPFGLCEFFEDEV